MKLVVNKARLMIQIISVLNSARTSIKLPAPSSLVKSL